MTNATATNRFSGKAKADNGGGDFKTEIPSADNHDARIVALIDLGSHMESYKGEAPKKQQKVYLVYELDEEMSGMKGVNHVVGVRYTLSFHEKATLRKLAETLLNDGIKFPPDADVDYSALVGQPCMVQVSHRKGQGEKADRTYADVGVVSAVQKKKREGFFKAKREAAVWSVGDPLNDLPDYLPRIYGETVEDVVRRCLELTGSSGVTAEEGGGDEGEVGGEPPF